MIDCDVDVGVLIDHDGSTCGFVDEEGTLIDPTTMTLLIGKQMLSEQPGGSIAAQQSVFSDIQATSGKFGESCLDAGQTQYELATALNEDQAIFAGSNSGRYWFRESFPSCDAILALAKVLDLLSISDARFSEVAQHCRTSQTAVEQSEAV